MKYNIGFGPLNGPGDGEVSTGNGITKPPSAADSTSLVVPNLVLTGRVVKDAHGRDTGQVVASWGTPAVGESTTVKTKVRHYLVSLQDDYPWSSEGIVDGHTMTFRSLPVGVQVSVRVRAERVDGQKGPYTVTTVTCGTDTTPPPAPSLPILHPTLHGVSVEWDGLDNTGQPMPNDLREVWAEVSTAADFSSSVWGGGVAQRGRTPVTEVAPGTGWTAYVRLGARDFSGNVSTWSAVATAQGIPVIAEDIGQGAVTNAALHSEAVDAYKIAQDAVGNYALAPGAVNFENVINGAISAAKTNLPAIDPNSGTLAVNAVYSNNMVATGTIIGSHIFGRTIDASKIGADQITAYEVHSYTITGSNIAGTTITANNVATNTLTSSEIGAGAITSDELYSQAVTSKYVTGGIVQTASYGSRIVMQDGNYPDGGAAGTSDALTWYDSNGNYSAQLRGYMPEVFNSPGLYINSHVQIGHDNASVYPVGTRTQSYHVKFRGGSTAVTTDANGGFSINFAVQMSVVPRFVVFTAYNASSGRLIGGYLTGWSQNGFSGILFRYAASGGTVGPASSEAVTINYYAESIA